MDNENQKITVRCNAEFSAELVLAVPYAYYLHNKGLLEKTISTTDSQALYFFSPEHHCLYSSRTIDNSTLKDLPNDWLHHNPKVSNDRAGIIDFSQWEMPPFKSFYNNEIFVAPTDKPFLIISNKYCIEWGGAPVNFIDIPTLDTIFETLKDRYTLIYKRPEQGDYAQDENENIQLPPLSGMIKDGTVLTDFELCEYHGVINFNQLRKSYKDFTLSYNTFQFMLFANCDYYISVQGGNSTLCSTFGKININYIKRGKELRPGYVSNINGWYYKLNNCHTIQVSTTADLLQKIDVYYGFL